jgi:hypothetical protein
MVVLAEIIPQETNTMERLKSYEYNQERRDKVDG